jgi:hypothetical protein
LKSTSPAPIRGFGRDLTFFFFFCPSEDWEDASDDSSLLLPLRLPEERFAASFFLLFFFFFFFLCFSAGDEEDSSSSEPLELGREDDEFLPPLVFRGEETARRAFPERDDAETLLLSSTSRGVSFLAC